MKVVFVEDEKTGREHKVSQPEAQEIFRLADKITDRELKKMAKLCWKMTREGKNDYTNA